MEQLVENCRAYNTPGRGRWGSHTFIPVAEAMLVECVKKLEEKEFAQAASFWQAIMEVRGGEAEEGGMRVEWVLGGWYGWDLV